MMRQDAKRFLLPVGRLMISCRSLILFYDNFIIVLRRNFRPFCRSLLPMSSYGTGDYQLARASVSKLRTVS